MRNMSNFLFILQVNSHPLKSMGRRQVRFPKISIYFLGPCLPNRAYNFRVQYLVGCFWIGSHVVTPACLVLVYWPQTYSSFCFRLLWAGPALPCLALPLNLKPRTPFHIEDWALQGSGVTAGLSGSGCLTNPMHPLLYILEYRTAEVTSSNTSVRGKVFSTPRNAFGMTGSDWDGFDRGGKKMQKVARESNQHAF